MKKAWIILVIILLITIGNANAEYFSRQKVSWDEVKGAIESYLEERLPWEKENIEIKVNPGAEEILLPEGVVGYETESSNNPNLLGKRVFTVNVKIDDKFHKKIKVNADVSVLSDVVISLHSLKRSGVISEEDISMSRMNLADLPEDVVVDKNKVIGKRLTRFVKTNTPFRENMLSEVPIIKQKDKVILLAESNGIKVTTIGEAVEDGFSGGLIRAINIDSKKEVFGRVLSAGLVRIEY